MTWAEDPGARGAALRAPGEAADCVVFRCEGCLDFIGDGSPIFMFLNSSYCSEECRRHGRSLRRRQLAEKAGGMRRPSSYSSGSSNWSSMVSETCSASSAPSPEAPQAPLVGQPGKLLVWFLGAGVRKLASMVMPGELIRAASTEWATSRGLRQAESASLSDEDLVDQGADSRRCSEAFDTPESEGAHSAQFLRQRS